LSIDASSERSGQRESLRRPLACFCQQRRPGGNVGYRRQVICDHAPPARNDVVGNGKAASAAGKTGN
jgi:hypothetical protein